MPYDVHLTWLFLVASTRANGLQSAGTVIIFLLPAVMLIDGEQLGSLFPMKVKLTVTPSSCILLTTKKDGEVGPP